MVFVLLLSIFYEREIPKLILHLTERQRILITHALETTTICTHLPWSNAPFYIVFICQNGFQNECEFINTHGGTKMNTTKMRLIHSI